ncbi:hypothetical protein KM043_013883 [Ampulex compressa]|nr:hypothetical protein KM043_013883 [Ampulex compressa]
MAYVRKSIELGKKLYYIPKPNRWQKGIGAELPDEYKKFWKEWKSCQPEPVHYIKEEGLYKRNNATGEVIPVQNIPIPLRYPKELNEGIWGGEAVIQGFIKRGRLHRRHPHFWIPKLRQSVVYSEVLDAYIRTVITKRTVNLIHQHCGFDHYLLKTPACDLRSELALHIKRTILLALADKTLYAQDEVKRQEVYDKYKGYLDAYTREEIEWYGLTYPEACKKYIQKVKSASLPVPLKIQYRTELLEEIKKIPIEDLGSERSSSWITRLNPFRNDS